MNKITPGNYTASMKWKYLLKKKTKTNSKWNKNLKSSLSIKPNLYQKTFP